MSLSVGDYRAGERTFQLLTQAVGRAGRGSLPGEAVIQTYQPDHYAIVYAANQDYESFYQEEILYRELGDYPPAAHMLAVQIYAGEEERAIKLAESLAEVVKALSESQQDRADGLPGGTGGFSGSTGGRPRSSDADARDNIRVIGPAPAAIGRINDIFRFVFYVKSSKYGKLVEIKDLLEENIERRQLRTEAVQFDFAV